LINKKIPPITAVFFSEALKGRKGEKEMGFLNCLGPKSRGERM